MPYLSNITIDNFLRFWDHTSPDFSGFFLFLKKKGKITEIGNYIMEQN